MNAFKDVLVELERATAKFPEWPTDPFHALAILTEEVGELSQTLLKARYEGAASADRSEAVQVAAMALRLLINWETYK